MEYIDILFNARKIESERENVMNIIGSSIGNYRFVLVRVVGTTTTYLSDMMIVEELRGKMGDNVGFVGHTIGRE